MSSTATKGRTWPDSLLRDGFLLFKRIPPDGAFSFATGTNPISEDCLPKTQSPPGPGHHETAARFQLLWHKARGLSLLCHGLQWLSFTDPQEVAVNEKSSLDHATPHASALPAGPSALFPSQDSME